MAQKTKCNPHELSLVLMGLQTLNASLQRRKTTEANPQIRSLLESQQQAATALKTKLETGQMELPT